MATKTQVLSWFRGQLGYAEGNNNRNKYAQRAGHANNQPWCATFIVAGFRDSGMTLPIESAWTPSLLHGLRDKIVDGPQVGALAFLYFPSKGRVAHVGIVESVRSDGRFVTIEGNTNEAGSRTGGKVMRKVRSQSGFTFAMPSYDGTSSVTPAPPVKKGELVFPTLKRGSTGQQVRNLQGLLCAAGRRVAIDGIYGYGTETAVKKYQQATGLAVDGMAGTNTFRRLLGV